MKIKIGKSIIEIKIGKFILLAMPSDNGWKSTWLQIGKEVFIEGYGFAEDGLFTSWIHIY